MDQPLTARKGRSYRGVDPEVRTQKRREALIAAGLELFGTRGYRVSSVKAVCDQVGLTERYFYESFANREALLEEVFSVLVADLDTRLRKVVESEQPSAGKRLQQLIKTFFHFIREDESRARVMLLEILGVSPAIDRRYQSAVRDLARLMEHPNLGLFAAAASESAERSRMESIGLVGAIVQIGTQWILENFRTPVADVERGALEIFLAVLDFRARPPD